jgi:hypothetical protein
MEGFAMIGWIISGLGLALAAYVYWFDRRPRLRFTFEMANTSSGGELAWCMKLKTMNVGRVTVMLEKVDFQFLEDGKRFYTWSHPRDLPKELPAGQSAEFELRADEMARVIGGASIDKSVKGAPEGWIELVPMAVDAVGRGFPGPAREWPGHEIAKNLAGLGRPVPYG